MGVALLALPLKLKYYEVAIGENIQTKEDDVAVTLYNVRNLATNLVEHEGLILSDVLEKAMALDRNMHRAVDFFAKNLEGHKWLDGCLPEEEAPSGIVVPKYLANPEGGGNGPPLH